jgi:hypothetical protein
MMARALPPLCALLFALGCGGDPPQAGAATDDIRTPTATVELSLDEGGKCVMRTPNPRVQYDRVVRLKNVGNEGIAALIHLWDNFGGMPAPEGGDIAPGQYLSVKMNTRWWALNDDPESREWSTPIVCKKGPWENDDVEFDEVGEVQVYR